MSRENLPTFLLLPLIASASLILLFTCSAAFAMNDNLTKGATNNHVFEAGIWGEYIDTLNGGLNLSIPIGPEYRVSADVSYQLKLSYSSKIWQLNESNYNQRSGSRLQDRGQAGLGFSLQLGRSYLNATSANCEGYELVFEDQTGAAHPAEYGVSPDGSYLRFEQDPNGRQHVRTPSGTRFTLGHSVSDVFVEQGGVTSSRCNDPLNDEGVDVYTNDYRGDYVTRIEGKDRNPPGDPNGAAYNWVDITYESSPGMRHLIKRISDSKGRAIDFVNTKVRPDAPTDPNTLEMGYVKSVTLSAFPDENGLPRTATYTFNYTLEMVHDPFVYEAGASVTDPNNPAGIFVDVLLLESITFPHNYTMKFKYKRNDLEDNYGFLRSRELPTGAIVEYDYESYPFAHQMCRGPLYSNINCAAACVPAMCRACYEATDFTGQQHFPVCETGLCGWCRTWDPISSCSNTVPGAEYQRWCGTTLLPGTYGLVGKTVIPDPNNPQNAARWTWTREATILAPTLIGTTQAFELRTLTNADKVVLRDPYGNETVTRFWAFLPHSIQDPNGVILDPNNDPQWKAGLVDTIEYYRGSADPANVVRTEYKMWQDNDDPAAFPRHQGLFKRVIESGVIYHDDGGARSRTLYKDWDGFGNFREVEEYDFGGELYRKRRADYNCEPVDANTPCGIRPAHESNWILDTYTYSQTLDPNGTVLQRSEFVFDNSGYLRSQRDLLTIPTTTGLGDTKTEFLYDGDSGCPGGDPNNRSGMVCSKTVTDQGDPTNLFRELYTYEHGPYLKTRQVDGMNWLAESRVIDASTGLTSLSEDPNGIDTRFTYDLLGRLTSITPDSVNGTEQPAFLAYDPNLRTTTLTQSLSPADFIFSRFTFDGLGRLKKVVKRQADGTLAKQETTYEPAGRRTFESEWVSSGTVVVNPTTGVGDPNRGMTYDYVDPASDVNNPVSDPFGRIRTIRTADGKTTRTDYGGLSSKVTVEGIQGFPDTFEAQTFYGRDAFGRLTQVFSPRRSDGLTREGADAYYSYDRLDRLTKVRLEDKDASGNITSQYRSFTYDALGRQTSATNPENGTVFNRRYDPLGNLLEREDAAGNTFGYIYDKASRLLEMSVALPMDPSPRILATQTYDQTGTLFGHGRGKLTTVISYDENSQPLSKEQRRYKGLNGRLSSRSWRIAGWDPSMTGISTQPELVMNYSYNGLGLLKDLIYPEKPSLGRTVANPRFIYANGILTDVNDPIRGSLVTALDYNPAGAVRRITTRGGVETYIAPDVRNRPASITVTGPVPPPSGGGGGGGGGGVILEHAYAWLSSGPRVIGQSSTVTLFDSGSYSYDGAGNITQIGPQTGGDKFWYDGLNRLVQADIRHGTSWEEMFWSYDAFGNMRSQERRTNAGTPNAVTAISRCSIDLTRNQITRDEVERMGGPASDPNLPVEYDVNGNLMGDRNSDRIFDTRNRLLEVHKKDGSLVSRYAYDRDGYRLSKLDASTGMTTYYLRDLDGQVFSEFRRPNKPGAQPFWARDFIYAAGRHVAMYENDTPAVPGGLISTASQPGETPAWVNLIWMIGSDLDLLSHRIHRTEAGQPTQVFGGEDWFGTSFYDPEVEPGHTYTYCVTAIDRSGLESDCSESLLVIPGDAVPPAAPGLQNPVAGDHKVELNWSAPPDPQGDLFGYYVYRRLATEPPYSDTTPNGGLFRQAKIPNPAQAGSFLNLPNKVTDLTAVNGENYFYYVKAIDTGGRPSPSSVEVSASPTDTTAPDPPQDFYAIPGASQVELFWRASRAADLKSYQVFRSMTSINPAAPGSDISDPDPNGPSYLDGGLSPNTQYHYRVRALDDDGNESALSDELVVLTRDPNVPVPGISGLKWGYCDEVPLFGGCRLPQNEQVGCDLACTYAYASHENQRATELTWPGDPNALAGFRVYSRRYADEPFQFSRLLPPPDPNYPLYLGSPRPPYKYHDFAPDPSDACSDITYRISAVSNTGNESTLSPWDPNSPSTLASTMLSPEDLTVPAEPLPRIPGTNFPVSDIQLRPEFYGLTLGWTPVNSSCGMTLAGYHVYRTRNGGGSRIRLTKKPVTFPNVRVEYLPILSGMHFLFSGPVGFNTTTGGWDALIYNVTAVDIFGRESHSSNGVQAHTDAENQTDACGSCGPRNTEINGSSPPLGRGFDPPDPNTVLVPESPTGLSWTWRYDPGQSTLLSGTPSTPSPSRNWALVKWTLPASRSANHFLLLQQKGADPNFYEVPLSPIPGDDAGIRQFVWAMPLELACEDANYAVKAEDMFGRPADGSSTSAAIPVVRHMLIPENPQATASNGEVTISWDRLPDCPVSISGHSAAGYNVFRSRDPVSTCDPNTMPPDAASYDDALGLALPPFQTSVTLTPPTATQAYWYRVQGRWGASGPSGLSDGVCISGDNLLHSKNSFPPLSLPDGSQIGEAFRIAQVDASGNDEARQDSSHSAFLETRDASASPYRMIGQSSSVDPAVKLYFYHLDHLGTPRVITDLWGQPVSKHKYLPFGEELAPQATTNTHKFTGHERDAETGMDYMLARYYGTNIGRFSSSDPLEASVDPTAPQSWNRYTYTLNNPLRFTDPDGKCSAPFGIQKGQVGICLGSFISAKWIGAGGLGDNRGPVGNDPKATFKAQVQLVVDPSRKTIVSGKTEPGKSSVFFEAVGRKGTASSEITKPSSDEKGNTIFTVTTTATNGLSFLPGAPKESIDVSIQLVVTPEGMVGVGGGERDAYPSLEIFSYDSQGNMTQILFIPEKKPADLAPPKEQKIPQVPPR